MEIEDIVLPNGIGTKRLLLCVGRDLHAEVKSRAALRNVTIQKYLLQALLEKMAIEDRYNQL